MVAKKKDTKAARALGKAGAKVKAPAKKKYAAVGDKAPMKHVDIKTGKTPREPGY